MKELQYRPHTTLLMFPLHLDLAHVSVCSVHAVIAEVEEVEEAVEAVRAEET